MKFCLSMTLFAVLLCWCINVAAQTAAFSIENDYISFSVNSKGVDEHFIDKQTNIDYCAPKPATPFASIQKGGQSFPASSAAYADGQLTIQFGKSEINGVFKITPSPHFFTVEVVSISDPAIDKLIFGHIATTLKGRTDEPFAACALALNLKTNVPPFPRPNSRLLAISYRKFGLTGAKVALIGCPQKELRSVIKEAVLASPDLPHSPLGGPWAKDNEMCRGSYLLVFDDLTGQNVDDWIKLAQSLGFEQFDFAGINTIRKGDFHLDPSVYPHGTASLKAVIDKIHAAGMKIGLHTYSYFLDKKSRWVSPVPDPRLAKDAVFTLTESIPADATTIPVKESTQAMSTVTGFHIYNSVTLQIDNELITYNGISKTAPYAFLKCTRGAYGTTASSHAKGDRVMHLKETFGLFLPEGNSTLFTQVAKDTADFYNRCGFDMLYLDALDGNIIAGPENEWHYDSLFGFEIARQLNKPALMEMSTFPTSLWYLRSRAEAWDFPLRGYKAYVDMHVAANKKFQSAFLPGELGWWSISPPIRPYYETLFPEDIEYLCCKSLASDSGLAVEGLTPAKFLANPNAQRFAEIIRGYEELRKQVHLSDQLKAELGQPGREFSLKTGAQREFQRMIYDTHKLESGEAWSKSWEVNNPFPAQPARLRIEALQTAPSGDAGETIFDVKNRAAVKMESAKNVSVDFESTALDGRPGVARFSAVNSGQNPKGAWAKAGMTFSPPLDMRNKGLGLWVNGDGQGEIINIQLVGSAPVDRAICDHYISIDFTGWRYFNLVEQESKRCNDFSWPYYEVGKTNQMLVFRETVDYKKIVGLNVWFNNLPLNTPVQCYLSSIQAVPVSKGVLHNPSITVGGKKLTFPVDIESGCYLETNSLTDCTLYDPQGQILRNVKPIGEIPSLLQGTNNVSYAAEKTGNYTPRANVTLIMQGDKILIP